jgi:hypothetical protein
MTVCGKPKMFDTLKVNNFMHVRRKKHEQFYALERRWKTENG